LKAPKNISYPIRLGKRGRNLLYSQEGEVRLGRWFDVNQGRGLKPKWMIVGSKGSLVDRAVGGIPYSKKMKDYAVLTYFTDPVSNMPRFDMVPIDSEVFDTEDAIIDKTDDLYEFRISRPTPIRRIPIVTPMAVASALLSVLVLAGSAIGEQTE